MRLTLRTLLAYLDDTLDPAQAREIGKKVNESHVAQELIERIKKVTRRRGLSVPPAAGPDKFDANTVAEYLDNDLPSDAISDVESRALDSDVHLAEIAACHQILTLVLGEPAHVPPKARERMYALVKGREAVANRKAQRVGPPSLPDDREFLSESHAARKGAWLRLCGAGALTAALAVALWQAFPPKPTALPGDPPSDPLAEGPMKLEAPVPLPEPDKKVEPPMPEAKTPDPAVPPPAPMPEAKAPEKPAEPAVPPKPTIAAASTERKPIASFAPAPLYTLYHRDGDKPWEVVGAGKLTSAEWLLSLPGLRNEVKFDDGLVLTLWGNLPEYLSRPPLLECVAMLHAPAAGFDAELTLDRGRIYLTPWKKGGPTRIRVRAAGHAWDVTLEPSDPSAQVLMDVVTTYAGEPFRKDGQGDPPATRVTLGVLDGSAKVALDGAADAVAMPKWGELAWWSKPSDAKLKATTHAAMPVEWQPDPEKRLARERVAELELARKTLAFKSREAKKSIETALFEMEQQARGSHKMIGILGDGALGNFTRLVDLFEVPEVGLQEQRRSVAAALQSYIALAPGNDAKLFEELKTRKEYGDHGAEQALVLLRDFTEEERHTVDTYRRLVEGLKAERVGLRELAAWRLSQLDPSAGIAYNAGGTEASRERGYTLWKQRVDDGKVPLGKPAGPQGRGSGKTPVRG